MYFDSASSCHAAQLRNRLFVILKSSRFSLVHKLKNGIWRNLESKDLWRFAPFFGGFVSFGKSIILDFPMDDIKLTISLR